MKHSSKTVLAITVFMFTLMTGSAWADLSEDIDIYKHPDFSNNVLLDLAPVVRKSARLPFEKAYLKA